AGAGYHPDPNLRKRHLRGLTDDPEVARERELEADAEAIAADRGDHRFRAPLRRGDVLVELRDSLLARFHEAGNVTAAAEMLPLAADDDDADPLVVIQLVDHRGDLWALGHAHDVERRPVQHDVRPLRLGRDLDTKSVEIGKQARAVGI